MAQVQSDTCNLAWFKLAEFVARREKERALGIYRLLVHSLPDEAVALQLEGDILLAFSDAKALMCYEKAAQLYEQAHKYTEAIAVYEHCITILNVHAWALRAATLDTDTRSGKYYRYLIKILMRVGKSFKAVQVLEQRSKKLLESSNDKEALDFVHAITGDYPVFTLFNTVYEQLFFSVLERWSFTIINNKVTTALHTRTTISVRSALPDYIKEHIHILIKGYITYNLGQQLNAFLSHIAVLYEPAHEYALETAQTLKI